MATSKSHAKRLASHKQKASVGEEMGFRSGMEERIQAELNALGVLYTYETLKLKYKVPDKTYTPDFVFPNGVIVETKGYFTPADRTKHLAVRESNPGLDIRFVFANAKTKLNKSSKTTYGAWCEKYGFQYAQGSIPLDWIKECMQ